MSYSRPYDVAFSPETLALVKERRKHPTGELHEVKQEERGGEVINVYPWKKLELGDFFHAPINGRSVQAMKVGFHRAAARYDYEISVYRMSWHQEDCLRVTLTYIGILSVKKKAKFHHNAHNVRLHDRERAKNKRRASVVKAKNEYENSRPLRPLPPIKPKPDPQSQFNPSPLPYDPVFDAPPVSREEAIRRALASKS